MTAYWQLLVRCVPSLVAFAPWLASEQQNITCLYQQLHCWLVICAWHQTVEHFHWACWVVRWEEGCGSLGAASYQGAGNHANQGQLPTLPV